MITYWASEASPLTTDVNRNSGGMYVYINVARKIRGTLLKASAMHCIGVAECSGVMIYCIAIPTFWVKYALARTIEKRNVLSKESSFFQIQKNSFSKSE